MTVIPFFNYTLYQMYFMYMIWSFIGWILEVIILTYETGEYQNRGFLNGPICPIYGVGVLMIVGFFSPLKENTILLFFGSMIVCTAFELGVGLLMEAVFHSRWWDYSHMRYNYKGLISVPASLFWGFGCCGAIKKACPFFIDLIDKIPLEVGFAFIIITAVLMVIDIISSAKAAFKLNDRLRQIDALTSRMLSISIAIGEKISDGTVVVLDNYGSIKHKTGEKIEEAKELTHEKKEELKAEYKELKEKFDQLLSEKISDRLIRAFPTLISKSYNNALTILKKKIAPEPTEIYEIKSAEVKKANENHRKHLLKRSDRSEKQ